jgi:anti-sigma-K factor RskA
MDLPDLARSRAILIGNGAYAEHPSIPDLPGAQACVQAMTALLTGPLCGWPAERITSLVDLAVPSELAVRVWEAVRDAEDVLLVYYVGHGMRTFDGQLALALAGTRPHPETLRHTAMLYPELASILRGARAPTKLVILDCCHAELGHRANYVFQSADLAEAYPVDGLYFIGASARDAKAKAPADGGLTYFTDAFVTTVTAGIPHRPPTLRLDQIFLELRARLLRANLPEPVEAGTRGAHQFPFARNAALPELIDEAQARERALREDHARRLQRLDARQSRTAPPTGTTAPENPVAPTPPSTAITGTAHPDPEELWPVLSRRSLLITAAVAALATGIGGAVWALTANTPALAEAALESSLTVPDVANSVAFSPGGRTLAAACGDGTVRLWNVTDPTHPVSLGPPLTGFDASVSSVAFSPGGRTLAAGGGNSGSGGNPTVRLWNVTDPTHPVSLGPPLTASTDSYSVVDSLSFSPDGHTLAATGGDGTVRLWKITDAAHPVPLGSPLNPPDAGDISSVAFSPDGRTLAAGGGAVTGRV